MRSVRFRLLSLIFLCFLPAFAVIISFLLSGADFLASLGILQTEAVLLSWLAAMPIVVIFVLIWQRYVLEVAFPPLSQAFFHLPNVAQHRRQFGLIGVLYAILALLMYYNYQDESIAAVTSISIISASLYGFIVVSEIGFHMAKDQRVWNPFKRELSESA